MDLSRRWSSRERRTVRPSIRLRANGPGAATPLVAAVAIGIAVAALGAALGAAIARPAGSVRATSIGAGALPAAGRSIPPAVPRAALPDLPWLAERGDGRWVFGRGERGPARRLPAGEAAIAISDAFVASVVPGHAGRSLLRFRDLATGRVARDVDAPIWISAGAWTPAGLVVTGYGDASMSSDGGLVLVSPETGASTTLVAGAAFSAHLGHPVARGDVVVSASGRTVASNVCGPELCDLQVVDLATGGVLRPIQGAAGFLRAVTDDTVITTDEAGAWISARGIADGGERWRLRNTSLIEPVAMADGSVVGLVGSSRTGWAVAAIDPAGRIWDLTSRARGDRPLPQVWRAFAGDGVVVVATMAFNEAVDRGRPLSVSIVSVRDGHASKAAVHLPASSEAVP